MTEPTDGFTELVDADIPRVDLVGKGANGTRFLLRKAADDGLLQPLVAPDQVRDLIAKADAQEGTPVTDPADVAKADTDPTELLATDADTAPGSVDQPGSPAWEAVDAATAQKWAGILSRAKAALCLLASREEAEAAVGDDDDWRNACDLEDASCAIDYAISLLAPYALGEQMEVELAEPSVLEAVGKAAAAVDAAQLGVVEALAPIAKAGRVLSSANESAIRTAVDSLTAVLNSLPQAPTADDVTKTEETAVTEPAAPEAPAEEPTAKLVKAGTFSVDPWALVSVNGVVPTLTPRDAFAAVAAGGSTVHVAKAKGDPQMAVFDAAGKLVGVIDPADLNPIADTAPPADAEPAADDAAPAEPAAETPAEPAPAAVPDEKVIPGTATVQAPAPEDDQTPAVAKTVDPATLEEVIAPLVEELRKHAELADVVKGLQERVEKMGKLPDNRRSPVLNGATGTPGAVTRDGDGDGDYAALQKAVEDAKTPAEITKAKADLAYAKIRARFQG